MANDDYFVIAYRILAYLYVCLKNGENANLDYLHPDTKEFPVGNAYWDYILRHLYKDDYIDGIMLIKIAGQDEEGVKMTNGITITPKGIEYLQNNSSMSKAKAFLKTIKEVVPGL